LPRRGYLLSRGDRISSEGSTLDDDAAHLDAEGILLA
jgi:hypothetical protein